MDELKSIKGLGPKRIEALAAAGIHDIAGLLNSLPSSYLYAQKPSRIDGIQPGLACLEGEIAAAPSLQYHGGRSIVRARLQDQSGAIQLFWFNQPWMAKQFVKNQAVTLYGLVQRRPNGLCLVNPKVVAEKGIIPQYKALPGLPGKVFAGFIRQALDIMQNRGIADDVFPDAFRQKYNLCRCNEALGYAHLPENTQQLGLAQRRLAFENLLLYQLAVRLSGPQGQPGPRMRRGLTPDQFWRELPFKPTAAQEATLSRIISDMQGPGAMRRLVQGDVGSGKTAVAFGAAVRAIQNGYQCALMAPTELLARQHYESAGSLLKGFEIKAGLLTGGMKASSRRGLMEQIADGSCQLVIGTHALISKDVAYHRLGLVITDEQHRFGVKQRQSLADRAQNLTPHMLALSATPIPRSLALVLYGDLQVSIMDELPPGRTPVKTRIISPDRRDDLYAYIREKALAGEQAYLVCPLIDEGEDDEKEKKSAVALFNQLKDGALKGIGLALTYGSQDAAEKDKALSDFYRNKAKVLVSTTVIEVGMDVPNATTMVIEDAENFGLAQLHQLRGRVGRGKKESWCFLLGEANERLLALTRTNDGFEIAQKDLELRGPGEFLGTRQHGRMLSVYGVHDMKLIEETSRCLEDLAADAGQRRLYDELSQLSRDRFLGRLEKAALH